MMTDFPKIGVISECFVFQKISERRGFYDRKSGSLTKLQGSSYWNGLFDVATRNLKTWLKKLIDLLSQSSFLLTLIFIHKLERNVVHCTVDAIWALAINVINFFLIWREMIKLKSTKKLVSISYAQILNLWTADTKQAFFLQYWWNKHLAFKNNYTLWMKLWMS